MKCLRQLFGSWVAAATLALCVVAAASPIAAAQRLLLNSVTLDTSQKGAAGLAHMFPEPARKSPVRRIVQTIGPLTERERQQLAAAGVTLEDYLPEHAFIARMRAWPGAAELPFVRWVGQHEPVYKLDPLVGRRTRLSPYRQALKAQGRELLDVFLYQGEDPTRAASAIERVVGGAKASVLVTTGQHAHLRVEAPVDRALAIASLDSVLYVAEAPEVSLRDVTQRAIVQSGLATLTPVHDHGVTGAGQIVGVIDTQIKQTHVAFAGKILQYNAAPGEDFHGTLVAGVAVGDAGTADDLRGVAYDSKLVYNFLPGGASPPGAAEEADLLARFDLHHSQGARVHTNSWGDDGDTSYNGFARAIDEFTWTNEDDVVVFAVTNQLTLRTPENAKNVLAVGASFDTPNQNAIGSGGQGPTSDNRRKPELFAPGISIRGPGILNDTAVTASSGTSFAAPAVAGAALLARQYFTDGFYPTGAANPSDSFVPTGALLRATLLNAASNMTAAPSSTNDTWPNNNEGFGLLKLDDALFFTGDTRTLRVFDIRHADAQALTTGAQWSTQLRVLDAAQPLRATLVWTDPPATLGAAVATVNDLDLEAVSPSGVVYKGNVFDPVAKASVAGGAFDDRNTVEQIHLPSPQTGDWTIRVSGASVNVGPQGFAVVVSGAVGDVPPCPADIDGDGAVGPNDLFVLLGSWGGGSGPADVDQSGSVGPGDLFLLLGSWGLCP